MVNLATIVDESKKTGCVYHIVYELAAYDLNVFLTTLPLDQRKIRNETAGPERTDSKYMWPGDLILESRNLADALDYLHNRLYNTSSISLSHNDIRPENILVVYPDSTDVPDRYPVGKWKIADFGLSRVKPKRPPGSKHLCAEEAIPIPPKADITHRIERSVSVSKTVPKRDPGRYTAPELDQKKPMKTDGRNADLWAFGCVLSEIITYAVNLDCQLVEDFREVLGQPSRLDHRFYDHVTKDVKPQFFNHLDKLSQMAHGDDRTAYNSQWVDSCVDLVKNVVVANPKKRLGAGEIRDTLRDIDITMRGKKKLWLDTCLHIDTTNITVGSTYSPGLAMPSATESPTEIKELDLAKGDPLSRTPSIVVSSASSVETRSSVAAEERKRRKTLPR
jgi:serine/threonine protein kinase